MVAITEKINNEGTTSLDHHQQTARIIQWLGGERAVDVPAEFDLTSSTSFKEDTVDHHILASKVECIELLRLKPLSQQKPRNTFERLSLLRRSSRRSRSSTDAQITDEAYCTLSSHRSGFNVKEKQQQPQQQQPQQQSQQNSNKKKNKKNNNHHEHLIRQGSTSESSSLSTNVPNCSSSPVLTVSIDDFYNTFDRIQTMINMDDEQGLHRFPLLTDQSMDIFREIIFNGERDFKELIEEFLHIIEKKLTDGQHQMFETSPVRASSPSLFDMLNDLKSCLSILRRTEMQSFLQTFDHVLKLRLYPSALPDHEEMISHSVDSPSPVKSNQSETTEELLKLSQYAIDELKIVKIEKNHEPLGLTISRSDCGTIHIARIVIGGIAANTQLFQMHDRILEINDEPITGRSLDYVCTLMSNSTGLMKFLLAPPVFPLSHHSTSSTFYVRALYGYDPSIDPLIPCKELGLAFQRGDILRIVARDENSIPLQNDQNNSWWQAYREDSHETDTDPSLAGLIPSDDLQQKRAALIKAMSDETESICSTSTKSKHRKKKQCFTCLPKHERKPFHSVYNNATFIRDADENETPTIRTSTNHFSLTDTRQCGEEQPPVSSANSTMINDENKDSTLEIHFHHSFRFYEPVFRLDLTQFKITRPIVLLGAPNVGRHELRRRLLQSEPHLFDVAIPHTTRARRLQEIPDIDYHFVSEADFLAKVSRHSFVEFGQFDRDLYGTSIDDIRHVAEVKRKICILNLNPDAIRTFDRTDLYPFIICIAAPSFERLKRLELDRRDHLTDDDYREIIRQSRSLERHHCLLFDAVVINNDLERTYAELRDLIIRIQHDDQQWVRASYRRT